MHKCIYKCANIFKSIVKIRDRKALKMSFSIITRVVDNCIDCVSSTSRLYCLRGHGHLSWWSQGQSPELHFKDTDTADIVPIQSLTSRPDIVTLTGFFSSVCLVWFFIEFFQFICSINFEKWEWCKIISLTRETLPIKKHICAKLWLCQKKASPFWNIRPI